MSLNATSEMSSIGGGFNNGGSLGLIGLLGLLNNRDCKKNGKGKVFEAAILSKLGTVEGAVPLAAAAMGNNVLEQTIALSNTVNQANLAQLQAASNLKDTMQNGFAATLLSDSNNTREVLGAISLLSTKMDQNRISELQTELLESRARGRARETEVNVSQTVNQVQSQSQAQTQVQRQNDLLNTILCGVNHTTQLAHATNQNIIAGNSGLVATGAQTSTPTNVNTK